MDPRRASALSIASVRQRKYSTDRLLRQAELSARLEEGRPLQQIRPDQIPEASENEDVSGNLESRGIQSLTRADTTVSPFDFHPGQRVNSFSFAKAAGINTGFDFSATKPWHEPNAKQQEDIERRAAVINRVETTSLDLTTVQAEIYRPLTEERPKSRLRRWLSFGREQRPRMEVSAIAGLHVSAAMNAALGLGFMAQKSPDWFKRQQLHVLEYTAKAGAEVFSMDSASDLGSTDSLKTHLTNISAQTSRQKDGQNVRIIQIRNNVEAFRYMDDAFAISSPDMRFDERGFGEWMHEDRDSRRTSNMTIRWRPGFDTNRGVVCMAVGIDLGMEVMTVEPKATQDFQTASKHQTLQRKRRIALYMQRTPIAAVPHPKVTQFNTRGHNFSSFAEQDNLVICEYSSNAWSELSHTPTLLALSPLAPLSKYGSAGVMASAINHIFCEVVSKWQSQIAAIHQPFSELEDLIYEHPADMTHSTRVWEWSKQLRTLLKLASRHLKSIQKFQEDFALFAELEEEVEWLDDVLMEMKHVADTLKGDYIEPLEHIIDLMYKSVTIRDSRLSLELGTSLWRLSWITFIFLPLTFLVGFFGMNVDTFASNPSINWYFISLAPLAIIITSFWIIFNRFGLDVRTSIDMNPPSTSTSTSTSIAIATAASNSGSNWTQNIRGVMRRVRQRR